MSYPKPVPANMQGGAGKSVFRLKFWSKVRPLVVGVLMHPFKRQCRQIQVKGGGGLRNACRNPRDAIQLDLTPA